MPRRNDNASTATSESYRLYEHKQKRNWNVIPSAWRAEVIALVRKPDPSKQETPRGGTQRASTTRNPVSAESGGRYGKSAR
jgi:hypothetical protein